MISFKIVSKKHGKFDCFVDDQDLELVKNFGNGSGRWCISLNRDKFYAQKRTSDGVVYLHRILSEAPKGKYVDHINGNTLDNRRSNLRVVKNSTNIRNGKLRTNNTSGMAGVRQTEHGTWDAKIKVNYKTIHLGTYKTSNEAAIARIEAERRYWSV